MILTGARFCDSLGAGSLAVLLEGRGEPGEPRGSTRSSDTTVFERAMEPRPGSGIDSHALRLQARKRHAFGRRVETPPGAGTERGRRPRHPRHAPARGRAAVLRAHPKADRQG